MKLERCHLMMLRTNECWCSRLGGLRKPILTSPQAKGLGRLRRRWLLLADHLHLRQGCGTPGLLSLRDAPHEALVCDSHVRQAVRHANVAVGWTIAAPHSRGPEALLEATRLSPG